MKAFGFKQYGGSEVQEFLDLDIPKPLPDELLVEVRAAGVNPVDWKIRSGLLHDMMPLEMPVVFGSEVSGVVRARGVDADGFAVGDEVFGAVAHGSGGFAEFALTSASDTAHKPPKVSFADACTLPVAAATGYDGVSQLRLAPGQTLLINGASGGVGVAATQMARDLGINVVGIAGADKKALVESLDATFIAYGDGVAILDLAGGEGLRAIAGLLDDRSKLVSAADPDVVVQLGGHLIERDRTTRVLDIVAAMVAGGKLDPHVQDAVEFDRSPDAVAAVETGHEKGKVIVHVS